MPTQTLPVEAKTRVLNISKILVPSDFSSASSNAFRYALRFGQRFHAELLLIHILEPEFQSARGASAFSQEELSLAEKNLRAWADSARTTGVTAKMTVRKGLPAHEITEAAKEYEVDLVIMATHGHTGWKHFCIGSTAEKVVRAAPCPVLVVREKEHEFV
jgi:nucleotide-binding universal stress UspA family protein